ncbi:MAG: hypothetical protein Q4D82_07410 [Neisseria sp.]|nr:hypothetical protein [Neisseria sp.]
MPDTVKRPSEISPTAAQARSGCFSDGLHCPKALFRVQFRLFSGSFLPFLRFPNTEIDYVEYP